MRTFCSGPDQAKSWRSRVAPFLPGGRKVIGVEPTFTDVYEDASGVSAEAIILPLRADYTQDVGALVRAARRKHRDAGFVYLCTPNNPTGIVVTQQEVRELLHGVPDGVPVLIDEAYHHYARIRSTRRPCRMSSEVATSSSRVSVGTEGEMARFLAAFREIL